MHTVILVDDEMFVRIGLRNLIDWQSYGYEVIDEADNGEDALELIKSRKPDLVITDIRMPVLDGLQLIGKAKDLKLDTGFIIVSGYNDFSYAQQAVRYGVLDFLLKPIDEEELTETLQRLDQRMKQDKLAKSHQHEIVNSKIIEALILGDFDEEQVSDWAGAFRFGSKLYYAFIELNDVHPWDSGKDVRVEHMKEQLKRAILEFSQTDQSVFLNEHHGRYGFIIFSEYLEPFQGDVEKFAEMLQHYLSEQLNGLFYIYVGKEIADIRKLKESYLTAKEALQYKFVSGDSKSVIYERVQGIKLQYIHADDAAYRRLVEHIEEMNTERMQEHIEEIFSDFQLKRFAPEAVKTSISHYVTAVINVIKSMEGDERKLETLEPIISWQDENITLNELKRLFKNFVFESAETIAKLRKDYNKGGIQKIKAYIESHYRENISLKSIAAAFYMNPVYLGQLFKKSYGMYFNEFLLQLRINEAKKLLRQTDNRVYEIAEKVGFSNADYFVTQFEKIEGMTPTEYRNKLLAIK